MVSLTSHPPPPSLSPSVYEKSYQNCNFQLTGKQIVILTPGVGVFEVCHVTLKEPVPPTLAFIGRAGLDLDDEGADH